MTKWNSAAFWKLENYDKDNKSDFIVPVSDFDFTDFDSNKSKLIEVTEFITIGYGYDDNDYIVLESDGKYNVEGECTLFPYKESRDWSTFKKPIKIKEGTPVMTKWNSAAFWKLENYTKDNKSDFIVPVSDFDFTDFDSNKSKSIV